MDNDVSITGTGNNSGITFAPQLEGELRFHAGGECLIRIAKDGFYVRDVKVEQGPGEAEAVYNAVRELLRV